MASPPPVAVALGTAPAVPAEEEGFEKLYRVYGFRRGKEVARTAFLSVVKDEDTLAAVLASAAAWREAWEAQGKKDAPRKELATWLLKGHWDEDPPRGYIKPTMADGAPKPSRAAGNDNSPSAKPCAAVHAKVHSTSVEADPDTGDSYLSIRFLTQTHGTQHVRIALEHHKQDFMESEQDRFRQLIRAVGLMGISDSSELHGREVLLTTKRGQPAVFQSLGLAAA